MFQKLLLTTFFLLSSSAVLATSDSVVEIIRSTDLSQFPKKYQAQFHQQMTRILVQMESSQKYPKYFPSRYSLNHFINDFQNLLINQTYAETPANMCLFGGWPSIRRGSCKTPWSQGGKAIATSMNTEVYDSDNYCGDPNLFRCNPLVFGPGIDTSLSNQVPSNVNGNKNNSTPYHSGICVNVSSGYNGLSQKCQELSERLDSIREVNQQPQWRESDFFNSDVAQKFLPLQESIATKCEENFERLNQDAMCTALASSMETTKAVVMAGKIHDIQPSQLFGACYEKYDRAPAECDKEYPQDYKNIADALESLKEESCNFQGIHAIASDSAIVDSNPNLQCSTFVFTGDQSEISGNAQAFEFYFRESSGENIGSITLNIQKGMSTQSIKELLMQSTSFTGICEQASCPQNDHDTLSPIYEGLEQIRNDENCSELAELHMVDKETYDSSWDKDESGESVNNFNSRSCSLSLEGNLDNKDFLDNLEFNESNFSVQHITLLWKDKDGNQYSRASTLGFTNNPNEPMTADSVAQRFRNLLTNSVCDQNQDEDQAELTVQDYFGLAENSSIPDFWKDKLPELQETLIKANVDGVQLDFDEYGNIHFKAQDENNLQQIRDITAAIEIIANRDNTHNLQLTEGESGLTIQARPSLNIEHVTSGLTLSQQQSDALFTEANRNQIKSVTQGDNGELIVVVQGKDTPVIIASPSIEAAGAVHEPFIAEVDGAVHEPHITQDDAARAPAQVDIPIVQSFPDEDKRYDDLEDMFESDSVIAQEMYNSTREVMYNIVEDFNVVQFRPTGNRNQSEVTIQVPAGTTQLDQTELASKFCAGLPGCNIEIMSREGNHYYLKIN